MYDIVFLSYNEPHAQQHWELLKNRFPRAKHVAGVEGIPRAHRAAAQRCKTKYFWVVDADNIVNDDFNFDFKWPRVDTRDDRVAVWRARNNVNGLEYGYGGIKLLPRQVVLGMPDGVMDFTTSISDYFHAMEDVASTTIINSSPYEAWKAGFRECAKLASGLMGGDENTNEERMATWMHEAQDIPNAEYCVAGARAGSQFGLTNKRDRFVLRQINDWEWLREHFNTSTAKEMGNA